MKRPSLSLQLYRRVLMLLALTGLAIGVVLYTVARREIGRASDAQLVNASRLLNMLLQDEIAAGSIERRKHDVDLHPLFSTEETMAFQASYDTCVFVVFWNNEPIASSGWRPPMQLVSRQTGLHDFSVFGDHWRSYGLRTRDPRLLIVVAERGALRDFSGTWLLRELALPMLALLIASMLVLWWTLRKSLSQVEQLASTLNARSLADLEPVAPDQWPRDLEPLVIALNKLFGRLGGAYELEQAFTDDVAHELRTPLAAIRAQAQLLQKIAPEALGDDVVRLIAMVDRANHLIDGMLTLARLNATPITARSIDVNALVGEVVADALMNLPADAIELSVTPDFPVRWLCDASLLQIALSAVVNNVTRHARGGGRLEIAIVRGSDRLAITVADRGVGIQSDERNRLVRRFEHGASANAGSGLGLSIATKAMALLAGSIRLDQRPDGPGLLVVLTLPSVASLDAID